VIATILEGILFMDMIISAESRSGLGKEAVKKVRRTGKVPAVYYGFEAESQPVSLDEKNLEQVLSNPKGLNGYFAFTLNGGDTGKHVLIRELQRHPVTRKVLHVDLVVPNPSKVITAKVPLSFIGRSIGVTTGGRARKPYREVTVSGLPENIPGDVIIDVSPIDQGQQIMASDLKIEACEIIYDRDFVIFKVATPRGGNKT
jgi:large subunit ribosomal protein L25